MDAEVMVGGSGKGDHPSFMALTLASDALKEIGFNLIVSDMSNFAEMTNAINAGTADMFAMAWQATPDPDMFQIYHSQGGANEKSYWIKDAELDDLPASSCVSCWSAAMRYGASSSVGYSSLAGERGNWAALPWPSRQESTRA